MSTNSESELNKIKFGVIDTLQFSEWIAERYNFIGGEYCSWSAKQYDTKDTSRYQTSGELFKYWAENIRLNTSIAV